MGYRHYHRCGQDNSDDSGMGCLIMIVFALLAMPLVGIYMMIKGKDDGQKVIGLILLIVGIIFWIVAAQG